MKPHTFKCNTIYEFSELIDKRDIRISKYICDSIIKNLKTTRKEICALTVKCNQDNANFDINIEREHFKETLQENLPNFESKEMYEECSLIKEAIAKLKD